MSEFGKGCTYCLALFIGHQYQFQEERLKKLMVADGWFNAASDHLYGLQVTGRSGEIDKRLMKLRKKCLSWDHGFGLDGVERPTDADVEWSLAEAKELLLLIDETILGVEVDGGDLR